MLEGQQGTRTQALAGGIPYAHFVRKTVSPLMTSPLGLGGGAAVIPIGGARAPAAAIVRLSETEGKEDAA